MPTTIYTDADNTLWDTDTVYQAAQCDLLEQIEHLEGRPIYSPDRLAFVREYDQAIASLHHEHLSYPVELLAHSLILGLRGMSSIEAAKRVIREGGLPDTEHAVNRFVGMLKALPPLLPGVSDGIQLAISNGLKLYVVTEGSQDRAIRCLRQHGLLEYTNQVLAATKTVGLYKRLKSLAGAGWVAMIGDQLDRDVLPAREADVAAIWIPSAFRPSWIDPNEAVKASFVATDFLVAIGWLLQSDSDAEKERFSMQNAG
jgi:putative hydrolase of the HAD superfamily